MLHGPFEEVAYSNTVPAPQPEAKIVPVVAGQTLLVILMDGPEGNAQPAGAVVTLLEGLDMLVSTLQLQRVIIVCAGPV